MKKAIWTLTLLLTISHFAKGQEVLIPENYSIVDSVSGDLDNDGISELVVAYNTGPDKEFDGVPRVLVIYKLENNQWIEWKKSEQALYGSRDGGMMGVPYGEMHIKNGVLLISHNGGSSWKWAFTDTYRFQNNEFYLIGYTSIYGKPCEHWEKVEFNLSSVKMIVEVEYEACNSDDQVDIKSENEIFYENGLEITLQNRQEREIMITTPKYGHEIYIAIGRE